MNTSLNIKNGYKLNKNLLVTLIEYMLGLLLILSNNSVYFHKTDSSLSKLIIISIIVTTGILALNSLIFIIKGKISVVPLVKLLFTNLVIVLIIIGISLYIDQIELSSLIRMILFSPLVIIYLYMYAKLKRIPAIVSYMKKIILFLAIISLTMYIPYVIGILHTTGSTYIEWGGYRYVSNIYNIQFFPQMPVTFLGQVMPRNTGIFTEAPMFSYILTIALIIHLFLENNKKVLDMTGIILVVTIFTTTSTTGVILAIFAYFLKIYNNLTGYKKTAAIFFLIVASFTIYSILKSKFVSMADSTSLRLDDFQAGIKALSINPLFGSGLVNGGNVIRSFMMPSRLIMEGMDGYSSGLFYSLSRIGIWGTFTYIIFPIIVFAKKSYNNFCFCLIFFILFIFTTVFYSYVFVFFVLVMYTSILYKREEF